VEQSHASQEKQSSLNKEVSTLRQSCSQLERAMVELQGNLERKNAGLSSLGNDLQVAEDQYQRLMGKVEEMQQNVTSRDNAGKLDGWRAQIWHHAFKTIISSQHAPHNNTNEIRCLTYYCAKNKTLCE
jgi:predicted nuclease with TOPRIM domain